MKGKLIDDVSIAEMQKMREAGMTNQDIANALDVSYQSVYRYIGKQPGTMRKEYSILPQKSTLCEYAPSEQNQACLVVTDRIVELSGEFAMYTVKANGVSIIFSESNEIMNLSAENLGVLISELQAIQRNIGKLNNGSEMW